MSSEAARTAYPRLIRTIFGHVIGAVRLIHPFPVTVVVVTTGVLLELAHHGGLHPSVLLRGCATVLLSQIAVGAYNDYVDRFSDAAVQPGKPIPSGAATPRVALALVWSGIAGTLLLASWFGIVSLVLVAAGTAAGLAYDRWLKPLPISLLGYIAGFLILVTWIWYTAGRLSAGFLLLYPAGALVVTAAHLSQSLPDIETDRQVGARGLAVALGVERSVAVITGCSAILAVGAAAAALRAGIPALCVGPVLAIGLLVTGIVRLRSSRYDRRSRETAFRLFAPALACIAITAATACVRLGIL